MQNLCELIGGNTHGAYFWGCPCWVLSKMNVEAVRFADVPFSERDKAKSIRFALGLLVPPTAPSHWLRVLLLPGHLLLRRLRHLRRAAIEG